VSNVIDFADYRDLFDKVSKASGWNHEQTRFWFNTPNPLIKNLTPICFWNANPIACRNWIAQMLAESTGHESN